jgi:hypothetical protein
MKIIGLIESMILEASKKDVLINKLGFSEDNAELLSSIAGPVSVWLGNKLIDLYAEQWKEIHLRDYPDQSDSIEQDWKNPQYRKRQGVNFLNTRNSVRVNQSAIVSIMDWIRVGLNGNFKEHQDKKLSQLYDLSLEWHDSLGVGDGDINYIEKNDVIRDYRKDGIGFYWTDLETNNSDEECNRMGHCGRTSSYNTIYSLRETRRINEQYTINKSHLTAAVGSSDGIIYQMKGPKNSKPKEEFHPYIVDLIINKETIQGFGSEYQSSTDFKITDLPESDIKKVYDSRPELFNTRQLKRQLVKMGILDSSQYQEIDMIFDLDIEPSYVGNYVDGDWDIRTYKDTNGKTRKISFIETLLSGDIWDLIEGYHDDWKGGLEYHTNEENSQTIRNIIQQRAGEDYDPSESLESLIDEYDNDYEIRNSLGSAYSDSANSSYYDYAMKELRSALEEYGDVTQLNDEGVTIRIDLNKVISDMGLGEEEVDEIFERCDESASCAFSEMLGTYYDKPRFSLDDRWSPNFDDEDFNSYLNDRLSEIN